MKTNDFVVGQTVYARAVRGRNTSKNTVIEKIGKKWITLDIGERFDPETMKSDGNGYASMYEIYVSEDEYNNIVSLRMRWNDFVNGLKNGVPSHITHNKMDELEKIINGS
jgi:hypothetical protein